MTDPDGGTVTNAYDGGGRVTSQTDPMGRTTTFAYSGDNFSNAGGTTTITDPRGIIETQHYAGGLLMSLTEAAGTASAATWSYTYDPVTHGRLFVTDPNGKTSHYTYDSDGNVLSSTDTLGNTTTYTYNSLNEPTSVTGPSGGHDHLHLRRQGQPDRHQPATYGHEPVPDRSVHLRRPHTSR